MHFFKLTCVLHFQTLKMLGALKCFPSSSHVLFRAPSLSCLMRACWGWIGSRWRKFGQGRKSRSSWMLPLSVIQDTSLAKAGMPETAQGEVIHSSSISLNQLGYPAVQSHFKPQLGQLAREGAEHPSRWTGTPNKAALTKLKRGDQILKQLIISSWHRGGYEIYANLHNPLTQRSNEFFYPWATPKSFQKCVSFQSSWMPLAQGHGLALVLSVSLNSILNSIWRTEAPTLHTAIHKKLNVSYSVRFCNPFHPPKLWYCTRAAAARGAFCSHSPMELLWKIFMWALAEAAMPRDRSSEMQSPEGIWDRAATYRQHRMGRCNLKQQLAL